MSNLEIIQEFVGKWSNMDAAELAEYFTEDGAYHNMPAKPWVDDFSAGYMIENFLASWTETQWDILNIAEQGDVVYCERLDRTKTTAGDVDLPCMGVFEMSEGKIKVWRDYFDMNTFVRAMS